MKEFIVEVTSVTTVTVEAWNEDEAIDKACGIAWEYDADEINAKILKEDEEHDGSGETVSASFPRKAIEA